MKQQQLFLGLEASSALLPILALEQVAELARGVIKMIILHLSEVHHQLQMMRQGVIHTNIIPYLGFLVE